jgi:hypothetical protein
MSETTFTPDQIETLLRKLGNDLPRLKRPKGKVEYMYTPCVHRLHPWCKQSDGIRGRVSLATGKFHCDDCRISSISLFSYLRKRIFERAIEQGITGEDWNQLTQDFIDSALFPEQKVVV